MMMISASVSVTATAWFQKAKFPGGWMVRTQLLSIPGGVEFY